MEIVLISCGIVSLLWLVPEFAGGGWRRVLPLMTVIAVGLVATSALSSPGARVACIVVFAIGAIGLRGWLFRRYPRKPAR